MPLFRGPGGAVFDITVPDEGTYRRELHDAAVTRGDLVPVEDPAPSRKRTAKDTGPNEADPEED